MKINKIAVIFLGLITITWITPPSSACASVLEITSPIDGTVVNPGQTITISVRADPSLKMVSLLNFNLHFNIKSDQSPNKYILTLSPSTPIGSHPLTACAIDNNKKVCKQIHLLVERADKPIELSDELKSNREHAARFLKAAGRQALGQERGKARSLGKTGEVLPLAIYGEFPDGSEVSLSNSTRISFVSEDTNIVKVEPHGLVRPISPGGTTIRVTYDDLALSIPVQVEFSESDTPVYNVVASQNSPTTRYSNTYVTTLNITNLSNLRLEDIVPTEATLNGSAAFIIAPTSFVNTDPNTSRLLSLRFLDSAGSANTPAILNLKGYYTASLPNAVLGTRQPLNITLEIKLPN